MSKRKKELKLVPKICVKCNKVWDGAGSLDFHHYLPNVGWANDSTGTYLCRKCHTEFHKKMWPHYQKKHLKAKHWYYIQFAEWLIGCILIFLALSLMYII